MQANPSSRWKNEAVKLVENHDFTYKTSYDAGREFRQEDHQCDFCGTHLRYTVVIKAKDNPNIKKEIGLDCLEHAFGTSWSRLQDVERDIEELKEEAKKKRRKEKYQEEFGELIEWIRNYLDVKYNGFLEDMLEILETGKSEWTRNMEDAVREIVNETDLEELERKKRDQERDKESKTRKIKKLKTLIEEVDDRIDPEDSEMEKRALCSSYDFAADVLEFLQRRDYITEGQMEAINDTWSDYKEKEKEEVPA